MEKFTVGFPFVSLSGDKTASRLIENRAESSVASLSYLTSSDFAQHKTAT